MRRSRNRFVKKFSWRKPVGAALFSVGFLAIVGGLVAAAIGAMPVNAPPSVRLELDNGGVCSGTHIGAGLVLTAAHCLHGEIEVKTLFGQRSKTEVLWANTSYDLALLQMADAPQISTAFVSCRALDLQEEIWTTGNPFGIEFITTHGVVSSHMLRGGLEVNNIDGKIWDERFIATLPIAPGNSGGSALDRHGNIRGVVVGMYSPSSFAIIVPSSTVCRLLGRNPGA